MADKALKKRTCSEAKRQVNKARSNTRVNLGLAFQHWRELRERMGMKSDSELAFILMDSESVHHEFPFMMSSPNEVESETCVVKLSGNGKELGKKDAASQRLKIQDGWSTTDQSENKECKDTDIQEDEDEEFSTSLSVGDGRYLVDLGSSSEFVVDEECILQLFKTCRGCNRQCTVRKHVKGLKLVVYQSCCFCRSCCKWTNLPDDDDGDFFQINGKDVAYGRTNSAK